MTTAQSSRNRRVGAAALALVIGAGVATSAHRRDEYLQAARLAIDPDAVQLELDLVPGIAVVDRVLPDIDANGDGLITGAEARAYADNVVGRLAVELDGMALRLSTRGVEAASVASMREGEGAIRITAVAALPRLAAGEHRLHYRNTHRRDIGVYLANALVPASRRVSITNQDRDVDQQNLVITYQLREASPIAQPWLDAMLGVSAIGLIVIWRRRRRLSSKGRPRLLDDLDAKQQPVRVFEGIDQ